MQTMNDIQMLSALKLPWDAISRYLETLISAILGRSFTCSTKGENDDYWRTSVLCDTFTNVEIVRLVNAVNGDDNMLRHLYHLRYRYCIDKNENQNVRYLSYCMIFNTYISYRIRQSW